jgi:hypothetical protein
MIICVGVGGVAQPSQAATNVSIGAPCTQNQVGMTQMDGPNQSILACLPGPNNTYVWRNPVTVPACPPTGMTTQGIYVLQFINNNFVCNPVPVPTCTNGLYLIVSNGTFACGGTPNAYVASFGSCPTDCGTAASSLPPTGCTDQNGNSVPLAFCNGQTQNCAATSACAPPPTGRCDAPYYSAEGFSDAGPQVPIPGSNTTCSSDGTQICNLSAYNDPQVDPCAGMYPNGVSCFEETAAPLQASSCYYTTFDSNCLSTSQQVADSYCQVNGAYPIFSSAGWTAIGSMLPGQPYPQNLCAIRLYSGTCQ